VHSHFSDTVIIKFADDTVILGLMSSQEDSDNYFAEVQTIIEVCPLRMI